MCLGSTDEAPQDPNVSFSRAALGVVGPQGGWLVSAEPCSASQLCDVVTGIEMEIVNSCEAGNGGCSHGCSHTSTGPLCTCPHGYELDEDQKTCIGASQFPSRVPCPSSPRPRCAWACSGVVTWKLLPSLLL